MAVEMGAKNGIVEPDETTRKYLEGKIKKMPDLDALKSDTDAEYSQTVEFDVSNMEPQVACPSSVDNVKPVSKVGNVKIDQAFIGSCTNGRLEDLQLAAKIMKGKKVADGVRALSYSCISGNLSASRQRRFAADFHRSRRNRLRFCLWTMLRRPHRIVSSRRNLYQHL